MSVYPALRNCTLTNYNTVALEALKGTRPPVYPGHRLRKGQGRRTAEGKEGPDLEHRRREGIRELNEDLSQFYLLADDKLMWECPALLLRGKHRRDSWTP